MFSIWVPSILFQKYGALFILINSRLVNFRALGLQEVTGLYDLWKHISDPNQFFFSGTLVFQPLYEQRSVNAPLSHCRHSSVVSLKICVHCRWGIDKPFDNWNYVGLYCRGGGLVEFSYLITFHRFFQLFLPGVWNLSIRKYMRGFRSGLDRFRRYIICIQLW